MNETTLRQWIEQVREGELPRRSFVARLVGLGLSAPIAAQLLMHAGVAGAQPAASAADYKPTRRGGGGLLKLLWWQGPTLLNPHFAGGTKDQEASRIFYEPLAAWSPDAELVPVLAAEIPSRANGGVAADGRSVTWKLKKGVQWHDGKPFTADDCVFNWQYVRDPATAAVTVGAYKDIRVVKVDAHTIRIEFERPTPFWAHAFVGTSGMIIPKHLFEAFSGAKSRDAPTNLQPVGTGPYRFVAFTPGDLVRAELNPSYHLPNRPHFDALEMKGGGEAVSAARAVLQTGEFDYAWNLLVEDDILKRLEREGSRGGGQARIFASGNLEFIQLNFCDPHTERDGERAHPDSRHPLFSDPAVRRAMALLIDRRGIQQFIYGRAGEPTANFVNAPARFRSDKLLFEHSLDKANAALDAAGWKRGRDGIRAKDGKPLKLLFQTSINAPRQKAQQVIKQAASRVGIDIELKTVTGAVFFSSDVANPDTYTKFWADLQMYTTTMTEPDPQRLLDQYVSWEIASKANKWQGRNIGRWRSAEYDSTYRAAQTELDPVKRAALLLRCNELASSSGYIVPLVSRSRVAGVKRGLQVQHSGWDNDLWNLSGWWREA